MRGEGWLPGAAGVGEEAEGDAEKDEEKDGEEHHALTETSWPALMGPAAMAV